MTLIAIVTAALIGGVVGYFMGVCRDVPHSKRNLGDREYTETAFGLFRILRLKTVLQGTVLIVKGTASDLM